MSHQIEGNAIPTPQFFSVHDFNLQRTKRVASGRLVTDTIATKKEFTLMWTDITGVQLDAMFTDMGDSFFDYTYPTETGSETVAVLCPDMPRDLWLNSGDKHYRDVTMIFIEQ